MSIRYDTDFLSWTFASQNKTHSKQEGVVGTRYAFGPLAVEYYTGDHEPRLSFFKGFRFVVWDRVQTTMMPRRWMVLPFGILPSNAIINLHEQEYWKRWSHGARNHYNKWFTQIQYDIQEISLDVFIPYFKKYSRPRYAAHRCADVMKDQEKTYGNRMKCYALLHKESKTICAGICTIDYPSVSQSYYMYSFYARKDLPRPAGVWLLNYWFMECQKKGIPYANLGTLYGPGQPRSWKGFSQFKMNFNPYIFSFKQPLFRFTFSWRENQKGDQELQ